MSKQFHPIARPYSWRELTPAEQEISRQRMWERDAAVNKRFRKILSWIVLAIFYGALIAGAYFLIVGVDW
jgi:hypothetical protein